MALTTVSFTTTFNFSTKKFNFVDTTNYAAQGIAANDVAICFKIIDPLGNTLYNNTDFTTPDISPAISTSNNLIDILLDSSGNIVQGQYIITATYKVSLDTLYPAHTVMLANTITLKYTAPTIAIALTSDCVTPLLKSVDNTDYRVNGITPTITRVHTIFFPAVLQLADLVGTGSTLQTSAFYTNEHSSEVEATLLYAFTGYFVSDVVTGTATIDVSCDAQLCDVYCCIAAEWRRYSSNLTSNKSQSNIHLNNWMKMMNAAGMIGIALTCGKTDLISSLTTFILDLGNCQVGCGCFDGAPVPVVGLGGLGSVNVAVDSGGAGITVTSETAGGVTTYYVNIAASTLNKINTSYNTTLVAGTNISLTEVVDANGNIQYTITGTTQTPPDMITLRLLVTNSPGNVATITEVDRKITGSLFKAPTYTVVNATSGFAIWKTKNNSFKITDFLNSEQEIKALISINSWSANFAAFVASSAAAATVNSANIISLSKTTNNGLVEFTIFAGTPDNFRLSNELMSSFSFTSYITIVIHR